MPYKRSGRKSYTKRRSRMSRTKKTTGSRYRGYTRTSGAYKRFDAKGYLPPGITRELKFFQSSDNTTAIDGNGVIVPATAGANKDTMCAIPQGPGATQREGRKIVISEVNIKAFAFPVGNVAKGPVMNRFIVILDTQCNGLAASINEILNSAGVIGNVWSAKNHYNGERFKFLYEEFWVTQCFSGTLITDQTAHQIVKSIKCNIPILYNESASTGVLSTIKTNNLICLYTHSAGNDGSATARLYLNWELRYYDD